MLDVKALNIALDTLEEEKKISREKIIDAVERSLAAAYQKEYGRKGQLIRCHINFETGETAFEQIKIVVDESTVRINNEEEEDLKEEVHEEDGEGVLLLPKYNEEKHILLSSAKLLKKTAELGDEISFNLENKSDFGRIAAQTAKQVVVQKIREAENESIAGEFETKEGSIVSGIVQRMEKGNIFVDLGRTTAILPFEEQIRNDKFRPGQRIKAYLYSIEEGPRGLSIRLSRSHPKFLIELFKAESSEIDDETVEIVAVAREPGSRSKIAVKSNDPRVDPIGACVGQRGVRVNAISNELSGEKIDIIKWSDDVRENIASSLSPAKVHSIEIDEDEKKAKVLVSLEEQSLAIGRGGQNVRLAAKLTGWKIDIAGEEGDLIVEADEEGLVNEEKQEEIEEIEEIVEE
ncbi:MAG TPA: transcription termination factor NusA [Candidatus Paceibacterota bacterium]|jgi:N utilization substance protein A|nr:transcription termination factor NusA [Candidatus Paceibacterota bacterium]HQB56878.1 transcription termination factor NusA [Candidatus Paceibacterota bacterium]